MIEKIIEKIIEHGRAYMKAKLGFCPEKSMYRIVSDEEFYRCIEKPAFNVFGKFYINSLTGIVKKSDFEIMINTLIHKYLGHGSYFEHNKYGKYLLKANLELEAMKHELIRGKVPFGAKYSIGFSSAKDSVKKSLFKKKYLVNINVNHPSIGRYYNLKDQVLAMYEARIGDWEGFAVWMQEFILEGLGLEIFVLKKMPYPRFFEKFKQYEEEIGIFGMLEHIGFPKGIDQK